ncbi:maltokinase N-terminal cap-like domain-containing protein [Jatrophihabitans fulvus]
MTADGPGADVQGAVTELVRAWLPGQRWFAGKGRDATLEVERLGELSASPQVTLWVARATYADGDSETYQVPLTAHGEPVEHLEHALLGTVETATGTRWVYDAPQDKDATGAWLIGVRDEATDGVVRFSRYVDAEAIPVDEPSLAMSGEQSNTSLVFGDAAIMKVFRRLQPGVNPDIEIGGELSRRGAANVPALLGSAEADIAFDGEPEPTSLAMVQEYLSSGTDGWVLATASVRDLMAEADLHADEAGGDFAGEAERLGAAVAQTHADLVAAFGTREASADEMAGRSQAMQDRLTHALEIVPELGEVADGLRAAFAAVAQLAGGVTLQRIHGDLHLGQVLRTYSRWVLIDFEGEPMAAIDARRAFDSALRDVAGMLRSFEYAGHHRAAEAPNDTQLAYRAKEWSTRNRDAFCDGYAEAAGADPREHAVLLRALEAEKAVYEAVYESRNRPTWLPIPLATLRRLAGD